MYSTFEDIKLKNILSEVTKEAKDLYGNKLKEIVLYGSYAKGQHDKESDIDLMLLIDADESELRYYNKELDNIMSEIGYRYMTVLSIIDMSCEKFNNWVDTLPFYRNIKNEGVIIYEQ